MEVFDRVRAESAPVLAAVAVGGALGASARWSTGWLVARWQGPWEADGWPWATFAVNLVGALVIGVVATRLDRGTTAWAFTVTGVLGGFTTYSSFAGEIDRLADADRTALAVAYAATTIAAGVMAVVVAGAVADARSSPSAGSTGSPGPTDVTAR